MLAHRSGVSTRAVRGCSDLSTKPQLHMSTDDNTIQLGTSRLYLVGRLGADIDVREYAAGKYVGSASLAVTQEGQTECEWFKLSMFDNVAVQAGQQLVKGQMVAVTAMLRYERWPDKGTGPNEALRILVSEIRKVGTKVKVEGAE